MAPPADFPAVRAAMAQRIAAFDACRGLGSQPGFKLPTERAAWKRLHDAADAAYDQVLATYASEILPATLGGEWRHTHATLYVPSPGRPRAYVAGSVGLFDHPLHFRRERPKGKLTWSNCALIGQPYLSKRADGTRDQWSLAEAAALITDYGVGVWARDDLSAWYPGWTTLVLAAKGLRPDAAASFGFTALATPHIANAA